MFQITVNIKYLKFFKEKKSTKVMKNMIWKLNYDMMKYIIIEWYFLKWTNIIIYNGTDIIIELITALIRYIILLYTSFVSVLKIII